MKKIYPKKSGNRFYLDKKFAPESFLFGTIPSFVKSYVSRGKKGPVSTHDWIMQKQPLSCSIEPIITWIGHASFLIQLGGINILTDPVFGDLWLFKRQLPAGIAADLLPHIDVVLLSHNHHDHMDAGSLKALRHMKEIRFLVPQGDKRWFDRRGFTGVSEHTWWDQISINRGEGQSIQCSFLPAAHWSKRGLFDTNRSLWGSWMIEWNGNQIYFGGDTAYSDHFSCIAHEFSSVDIALLPIGPCEPREWMKRSHLSAAQAGQAFLDLDARHFVPMHWGTFTFGVDHFRTPLDQLQFWWSDQQEVLKAKQLHVVKVGQQLSSFS